MHGPGETCSSDATIGLEASEPGINVKRARHGASWRKTFGDGFHPSVFEGKVFFLALLCVAHFLSTFIYIIPGPLSDDEAIYHLMARSFSERGSLAIWNGYEEFPSPELGNRYTRAREGRLVPQYPSLFPVLALPFYRVFGFFGLFVMNALSFVGVVVICFFTARKLFGDAELGLDSCLIFVLATFAWEYSQAAWPHILALLFLVGAFYMSISAYFARTRVRALGLAAVSGAVAAAGLGLRVDGILVFPALVLPFFFARPSRPLQAVALLLGTLPGFALLSVMNEAKFGVFSPFSYGEGAKLQIFPPLVYVAAGLIAVAIAWIATRQTTLKLIQRRKIALGGLVTVSAVIAVVLFPEVVETSLRVAREGYASVVDIRWLPADRIEEHRSSGGGVLYIGAHKKALLQSLPYLGLLLVPLARMMRPDRDFFALAALLVTPFAVIAFYAYSFRYLDWGGLCLNTRYFLLGIPFISILCAYAIRDLKARWGIPFGFFSTAVIGMGAGAAYYALTQGGRASIDALEFPMLVLPLWMAAALAAAIAAGLAVDSDRTGIVRAFTWVLIVVTMTWAGIVSLFYDYPAHRHARAVNHFYGLASLEAITPDSIFFSDYKTFAAITKVIEKDRVRIGLPSEDGFKDFPRLLDFELRAGRRAFALFHDALWRQLQKGVLSHYRVTPMVIFHNFTLSEISTQ